MSAFVVRGTVQGGGDDRGVRQHPAGSQVASRGRSCRACVHSSRTIGQRRAALRTLWMPDVRRHGSVRGRGRRVWPARRRTPRCAHSSLPLSVSSCVQDVAQLDQHLDVERRVAQPVFRQRPGRPVGGRVPLLQPQAEHGLDHRAEPDPLVAEQPPGQLGVEQLARPEAQLGQARQVLGGGVQHDLGVGQRRVERRQVGAGDRVDQRGARPGAAQLHQIGAAAVAVAGGALGVDGDRPGARGEGVARRAPRRRRRRRPAGCPRAAPAAGLRSFFVMGHRSHDTVLS